VKQVPECIYFAGACVTVLNPDEIASQVTPVKSNIHAKNNIICNINGLFKFPKKPDDELSSIYDA
jgi:hypothetical protein